MTVLITGASGFVGKRVCRAAEQKGIKVRRAVRRPGADIDPDTAAADLDPGFDWSGALEGINAVIHLAGRVHVKNEIEPDPRQEYRRINTRGTINLARQAAEAGVERFVFISSMGVHGTCSTRPLTEKDPPEPANPYAESKLEAENGLRRIEAETGMEAVIIRPPLVWGPDAPGNFGRLVRLVQKGLPLPFALVENKRSMVAAYNLADLIWTCVDHPAAAGQTFLVSDGIDLSTPELIRKIGTALGRPARLFPVPVILLKAFGIISGYSREVERLTTTMRADITHTCRALGWRPTADSDAGITEAAGKR
ncbi:MAG: NAD-dependent epimerase/dehydratase family protein [Desulfosalsimonas sp.]